MVELDDDGKPVNLPPRGENDGEEEEEEGLMDLMTRPGGVRLLPNLDALTEEERQALEERRCQPGKSRSSTYDSKLGLSCHFCRQKTLCIEPGCPRCSLRVASAVCVGKSSCSRCLSATGVFCRACLHVRYGEDLDEVRADPGWLCPHCYVEEHGAVHLHGWFCNSSFCMQARGMKETGQKYAEARALGFKSVQHMLQSTMKALSPDELVAFMAGCQARAKPRMRHELGEPIMLTAANKAALKKEEAAKAASAQKEEAGKEEEAAKEDKAAAKEEAAGEGGKAAAADAAGPSSGPEPEAAAAPGQGGAGGAAAPAPRRSSRGKAEAVAVPEAEAVVEAAAAEDVPLAARRGARRQAAAHAVRAQPKAIEAEARAAKAMPAVLPLGRQSMAAPLSPGEGAPEGAVAEAVEGPAVMAAAVEVA
ncbi:hypothetical protein HYH03_001533 [Edaphochlamys debaryana]|uniref:Zinc-finger domain-containing protein n=1 Tax=Edaphochlamys debaryana TaxID=47281 RepID=A0A836C519_9CHLO|nr:hypothetical protein HYH03_001533 [Edaphochlamys debaryana]|eukprot:KAG2500771.1 hypothetical protein HYH03_001533 [Edaphochlamys debaryana]